MRKNRLLVAATIVCGAIGFPSLALADIPPPEGYVESCTPKKACGNNESDECGAYYGDPHKCDTVHAADGFARACRTHGASVWTEVWCRTKEAKDAFVKRQAQVKTTAAAPSVVQPVKAEAAANAQPAVNAQPVKAEPATAKAAVKVGSNKEVKKAKAQAKKKAEGVKAVEAQK